MPRRRGSRASTSSEHSTNSDQSESSNISEELPDPGLPKTSNKDGKKKKKVSFNFPVQIITKTGKISAIGTVGLRAKTSDGPPVPRKTKEDHRKTLSDRTRNDKKQQPPNEKIPLEDENEATPKPAVVQEPVKHQGPTRILLKQPKKPTPVPVVKTIQNKKGAKKHKKITPKEVRETKKKELDALKKWAEEEKQANKEFELIDKIFKPPECLKYMNVEIHPELASTWFIKDVIKEVTAIGVKIVEADDLCDPCLLMWTRYVPPVLAAEVGQIKLTPTKKQCDNSFYIMTADEVVILIVEDRFRDHIYQKHEIVGGKMTIIIFGATLMFVNHARMKENPKLNREKFANVISDIQMELMVNKQIDLIVLDSVKELAMLIINYTKAIAEAPYVKAQRENEGQANFYMKGDNKNCVLIDKYGNGLNRLWEQMIAVLPRSSLEIARAIGAVYKTPRALSQEFRTVDGTDKVADLKVMRSNLPGVKSRKVGPEFARKLYMLFTSEDGNMLIE